MYAKAKIAEYWVVDVGKEFCERNPGAYQQETILSEIPIKATCFDMTIVVERFFGSCQRTIRIPDVK